MFNEYKFNKDKHCNERPYNLLLDRFRFFKFGKFYPNDKYTKFLSYNSHYFSFNVVNDLKLFVLITCYI